MKARVDDFDVKAFEEKAKRYVAEKNFSARANSELALYNLKMKTNRLALLQYNLDLELIALAEDERNLTERFLNDEFVKAIETQSGLLGRSVLSASQIGTTAQAILNTPFHGASWSDNIWKRQTALREVVARMTERLLLQGKNPTTMVAQLRKEFNVTASEAKRLAVTEGARVATEGQKQAYIANGYDEYEFIAEPSACRECAKLDGKIFKVKDMEPGENAAPMHPWCHCSTGANVDDKASGSTRDEFKVWNFAVEADNEKVYNQDMFTIDLMAKQRSFTVGNDIRVKTKKLNGTDFDFWVQDNTKRIRDTVFNVQSSLNELKDYPVPTIVFLKKSRLPGFAGYDYKQDILFVSDMLYSEKEFAKILSDNYFAAQNIKDTMVHELTHKKHWDSAKAFYKANKKRYNNVEQAMSELNSPLVSYVKEQLKHDFNYLVNISPNADEAFILGNVNELVAEVAVLGERTSDQILYQKVQEVLSWK
ncbi:TPA: minor capsid protein [Streptococcus suis]